MKNLNKLAAEAFDIPLEKEIVDIESRCIMYYEFNPTENIVDAWNILEKIQQEGWGLGFLTKEYDCYKVFLGYPCLCGELYCTYDGEEIEVKDKSVAKAITIACLKAKGYDI